MTIYSDIVVSDIFSLWHRCGKRFSEWWYWYSI